MKLFSKCILVVICGMSAFLTYGGDAALASYIRISPMPTPPLIDGKIQEGEWREASESFGAVQLETNDLAGRVVDFFIGYDTKNLYFPCKKRTAAERQDLIVR